MWKSLGDKTDIISHDEKNRPRKIRTNVYAAIIMVLVFVVSSFSFGKAAMSWGTEQTYQTIKLVVYILSLFATPVLFILKYIKNNQEIDISLLLLLFAVILFATLSLF